MARAHDRLHLLGRCGQRDELRDGAVPGEAGASRADLSLTLKGVESNVALGDEAFALDVPAGARGLTLAELRQAGVLR